MKKIEDYLHLYLGCECISLKKKEFGALTLSAYLHNHIVFDKFKEWNSEEWKLILRPLSDMTEEEKKHIDYPAYQMFRSQVKHPKTLMPAISRAANQTFYLLSIHIDIFNLIEAGLAIDKSTLK